MYSEDDYLLISGIQHFVFCRRQWALIHIEQLWSENYLTAEGRIIHEKVHNAGKTDIRNGLLTVRGMQIKSPSLGLTGQCDAVEFIPSKDGITLFGRNGKWQVRPVEYKHGGAKINESDRLQAAAQAICLEEMFCCEIPEAAVFYHETRRRETVIITNEVRNTLLNITREMHELFRRGYTPRGKPEKKCRNCSLVNLCVPKLFKNSDVPQSAKEYMEKHLNGENI